MGMKWKNGIKKILTQALVASLLLAPAVLSPTGTGEGDLPGEVLTGSEQPGTGNEGDEGIMPCGDWEEEDDVKYITL